MQKGLGTMKSPWKPWPYQIYFIILLQAPLLLACIAVWVMAEKPGLAPFYAGILVAGIIHSYLGALDHVHLRRKADR